MYEYKFFKADQSEQAETWVHQKFAEGFRYSREIRDVFGPNKGEVQIIVSTEVLPDSVYDRIFESERAAAIGDPGRLLDRNITDYEYKFFKSHQNNQRDLWEHQKGKEGYGFLTSQIEANGDVRIIASRVELTRSEAEHIFTVQEYLDEEEDDFGEEDDEEDDGGFFSFGFGLGDDGSITSMDSDGDSLSFSFTVDEDGEDIPTIQCPKCSKTDVELIDIESDMYKCSSCGFEFVPQIYQVLSSAEAYIERGEKNLAQENYKRAIKDAKAAMKLDWNLRKAHLLLGRAYEGRKEFEQAEAAYSEAIQISPDYDVAYFQRGCTRIKLEKFDEAIADFTKSIGFDPNFGETYRLRAVAYLKSERYQESVLDFSEALKRDPDKAQTWFERGYAYSMLEEHDKAIQDYSNVIKRNPGYPDSYYRRAESLEKLEQYQDAVTDYKSFLRIVGGESYPEIIERINTLQLRLDPNTKLVGFDPKEEVPIWEDVTLDEERKESRSRDRGEELLNKGDLDGAYKEFSAYMRNVPNSVIPYVYRACVNYKAGKLNEAVKDLTGAIECDAQIITKATPFSEGVDPRYEDIYLLRAYVNSVLGKQEEVQNDLVEHLRFRSEKSYREGIWSRSTMNLTAVEALGGIFAGVVAEKPEETRTPLQNALLALIMDDRESALETIGKAIRSDPKNSVNYWARGFSQPELEDALEDFSTATELAGGKAKHFYVQGFKKMLNNKIREGHSDLLKAISLDPDNAEYHEKLGVFLSKSNQHNEAIKYLTKAIELNPDSKDAYFTRGVSLDWTGDTQAALADLERAIALENKPGNLKTRVAQEKIREIKESEAKKQALLSNLGVQFDKLNSANEYIGRGQVSLKAGEWEPAFVDFNEAIKLEPKNAEAYRFRGATFYKLGDSKSALQDYNQAIALDPNNSELYLNRGILQADSGDGDNALTDLDEAIRLDPNNAMAFHIRAKVHAESWFNEESIDQATEDFEQAIKLNPDDPQVYFSRAEFWRQPCFLDTEEDALADLDQAIRLAPENAAFYLARFKVKAELKDAIGASEDLAKAYQLDPNDEEIKSLVHKLTTGEGTKNEDNQLMMNAVDKMNRGDSRDVSEDIKKAAQLDADDPNVNEVLSQLPQSQLDRNRDANIDPKLAEIFQRGMDKFDFGDYKGAIKDFSIAIEMFPDYLHLYNVRCLAFEELGMIEEAIADATTALRLDPNDDNSYCLRASLLVGQKQYSEAIEDLNKAIALNPESSNAYLLRGEIFFELKDFLSSASDKQTYVLLDASEDDEDIIIEPPDDSFLDSGFLSGAKSIAENWTEPKKIELFNQHMKRAIDRHGRKNYEEALGSLEIAHNLNPAHEAVYGMRMLIYDALQDADKGIANLAEQAQFYPEDSVVRMNLGILRSKAGQNKEALGDMIIAAKLDPENAQIRLALGTLYLMANENEKVVEHLTRCIELDPTLPDAYLYRASAKEKIGDYLDSIPDLEKYVQLGGSPNANIQKVKIHIEELKAEYGWEGSPQQLAQERERLAQIIAKQNTRKAEFEERKRNLQRQIEENNRLLKSMTIAIEFLRKERNGLSLLAFGKKKEINQTITDFEKKIEYIKQIGRSINEQLRELKM